MPLIPKARAISMRGTTRYRMRRCLAAGVVAVVTVALGVSGVVAAQADPPPPPPGGANSVVAWGVNQNEETDVPASLIGKRVTAISAGWFHTLALTSDGKVTAWGYNSFGETNVPSSLDSQVVTAVAAGSYHSLALTAAGTIVGWGLAREGQLTTPPASLDGKVVTAIAAGDIHNLALTSDGTVTAWGYDNYGQTDVPASLAGKTVTAIAAGKQHSMALTSDGKVTAWGWNADGQTNVPASLTGKTLVAIAAGVGISMALTSEGSVVVWGRDYGPVPASLTGKTIIGIAASGNFMVLTSDGLVTSWGGANTFGQLNTPAQIAGRVSAISAGLFHSVAVVDPDQTPPVIAPHDPVTAPATQLGGGSVVYDAPAATDNVDGPVAAACLPVSGSIFALGDTRVSCTAQDAAGNQAAPTSFLVHVDAAAPAALTEVNGDGQTALGGAAFADPLQVRAVDAFGNVVPAVDVTFTSPTGTVDAAGATFTGAAPTVVTTNGGGIATAPPLTAGAHTGVFSVVATVQTAAAPLQFDLAVVAPPSITGPSTSTFVVGTPGSYSPTLSGFPAAEVTLTGGTLPAGLTLDRASGIIAGTPTVAGSTSLTLRAVNDVDPPDSLTVDLTVEPAVTITTTSLPEAAYNTPYSTNLAAAGGVGQPYTWALQTGSALPDGLHLAADGTISGTPSTPGVGSFLVTATDPASNTASGSLTIVIRDATAPDITSHDTVTVAATKLGGAVVSFTAPTAVDAVDGSRPVSCVPASGADFVLGNTTVTCTATDTGGNSAESVFTVHVTAAPASVISGSPRTPQYALVGSAYHNGLSVDVADEFGNPVPQAVVTFDAPAATSTSAGGVFAGGNPALISTTVDGVAVAPRLTAGLHTGLFTVTAAVAGVADPVSFAMVVAQRPSITGSPSADFESGTAGRYVPLLSGYPAPTVTLTSGTLPAGLSLDPATGTISGTPTTAGSASLTLQASNGISPADSLPVALTVRPSPTRASDTTMVASADSQLFKTPSPVRLTATVAVADGGSSAGTVVFARGGQVFGTVQVVHGRAGFTVPNQMGAGVNVLTATFRPTTPNVESSTSDGVRITVHVVSTTTLTGSAASQVFGTSSPVRLTAAVAVNGESGTAGTVTFKRGTEVFGTVPVGNGRAGLTLPNNMGAGVSVFTATFAPSNPAKVNGSASAGVSVAVHAHSTTALVASDDSQTLGTTSPVRLVAGVAVNGGVGTAGTVTFRRGTQVLATVGVINQRARYTLPNNIGAGRNTFVATFNPTATDKVNPSTSNSVTVTVNRPAAARPSNPHIF